MSERTVVEAEVVDFGVVGVRVRSRCERWREYKRFYDASRTCTVKGSQQPKLVIITNSICRKAVNVVLVTCASAAV
jgi:hypothetical protein